MSVPNRPSIVHLHLTRACNLKCLHCYSSSEPRLKGGLELEVVLPYLAYLKEQHHFTVLSISGGEPFLYAQLGELLQATKALGYYNQLVTNAMLLRSKRNAAHLDYLDAVAVSIDGTKALHNFIRASDKAYDKMLEGVEVLRAHKQHFGFIHSVSRPSWTQIPELLELAEVQGAQLLQLHPLEHTGRAALALDDAFFLTEEDLHRLYILAAVMRENSPLNIQLDLLHQATVVNHPKVIFGQIDQVTRIQDLCKELIITETGKILPISYGFSENYLIHDLQHPSPSFEQSIEAFLTQKGPALKHLLEGTYQRIIEAPTPLFNWTERIVTESHQQPFTTLV